MNFRKEGFGWKIARDVLLICGLFLILFPLFLVLINSFKSLEEAGRNFFALPSSFNTENFRRLFENNNYWVFVKNSLIISAVSVTLILILVPSVSYSIARNYTKKYYKGIYFYLLMGLFIPSQVIMLPVTKLMTNLNLLNRQGLIRNGTPEMVRKETRELLERCGKYPNFVIASGCDIPPMSPLENIQAFFDTVAEFYENK